MITFFFEAQRWCQVASMNYATFEDLQWFSLDNYKGLLGADVPESETSAQREACFRQWAMLIRDRVSLEALWNAGMKDYVREQFEAIKRSPLGGLGFSKNTGPASQANLVTVRSMTSKRVRVLHNVLQGAPDDSIADLAFKEKDESLAEWAHLMIHTTATKAQILADVSKWLNEHRKATDAPVQGNYRSKIATWARSDLIAYFDLMCFATISGKSIKEHDDTGEVPSRGTLLDIGTNEGVVDSNLRTREAMKSRVFNEPMAQVLSNLAEHEHFS